jgi:hypothetical protein
MYQGMRNTDLLRQFLTAHVPLIGIQVYLCNRASIFFCLKRKQWLYVASDGQTETQLAPGARGHMLLILDPTGEDFRLWLLDKKGGGGRPAQPHLINHRPGNTEQAPLPRCIPHIRCFTGVPQASFVLEEGGQLPEGNLRPAHPQGLQLHKSPHTGA